VLTSDLFGLPSARPPQNDDLLAERNELLSKSRFTKKDRERLRDLEEQMESLPAGETTESIKAMNVIHSAAKLLQEKAE
jgi:hypothetical protein